MKTEDVVSVIYDFLPRAMADEIMNLCRYKNGGVGDLREIRVRRGGYSSVKLGREKIPLKTKASSEETDVIIKKLTGGSLYAHRDQIAEGFISAGRGIRVGVVGSAGYEGGGLVGISEISSLLFRLPAGGCAFSDRLLSVYRSGVRSGMLIYSPPGVGKTTALRALAGGLGRGAHPLSVAVVDERREFSSEDYTDADVDILSGYRKCRGIEIATRTMHPDVILIDEIGAEEAAAVSGAVKAGVPIVATAHAGSFSELSARPALAPLFRAEVFDVFVGISEDARGYFLSVDRR